MITLDARPKEPLKEYVFRSVFKPDSTQLEVFERTALPLVMHVLNGYNGTIFMYGQSGSGKTFTMLGPDMVVESITKGVESGGGVSDEVQGHSVAR